MDQAVLSTDTLMRYAHTLRHLKPWQIGGRIVADCKRKIGWTRLPVPPPRLENRLRPAVPFPAHDPWNTKEDVRRGCFKFLNEAEDLGQPVDWAARHKSLLWRFNLHYFHFLHLLRPAEQSAICRSWISANPPATDVSWHPYPTSLRIVNWCRVGLSDPDFLQSLYLQAAYLFRNLETYVYGNHLLENARALVMAGRLFDGQGEARRWFEKGMKLYRQETDIQILSDGGHFERSPMYHALVLEGYLDVVNVLPTEHNYRRQVIQTVQRMADVLLSLTHPDGHLALFNDSTQEIAPSPTALQQYTKSLSGYDSSTLSSLPEMGYFIHRSQDVYLIIDGGVVGPDHLLAHAHADIFSYELSLGDKQVVVDSGVYEYHAGPMRQYLRSTAAHNTVSIDGRDQVECWGSFRVARRFAPHDIHFSKKEGASSFTGSFSGYAHLLGDNIWHRRNIQVDEASRTVCVWDRIDGSGQHKVESRVHLHPQLVISNQGAKNVVHYPTGTFEIITQSASNSWEKGWYCPRFGVKLQSNVLVCNSGTLSSDLCYRIQY